jgi:hypothetical protein
VPTPILATCRTSHRGVRDSVGDRGTRVRRSAEGTVKNGGVLALVLASVLWGTTGTAASWMPHTVSPMAIGAATMTIGGALLAVASAGQAIRAVRERASRRWVLAGALGVFVYPLAFYTSMGLAGVAIGNVVSLGSGPVFAALFEWAIERRRPTRLWLGCTIAAVLGVAMLALAGRPDAGGGRVAHGVLFGLLAGLSYAFYTYASSRAIQAGASSRGAVGAMFGVGAIALLPVLLDRPRTHPVVDDGRHHGLPRGRAHVRRLPSLRRGFEDHPEQHGDDHNAHRARGRHGSGRHRRRGEAQCVRMGGARRDSGRRLYVGCGPSSGENCLKPYHFGPGTRRRRCNERIRRSVA